MMLLFTERLENAENVGSGKQEAQFNKSFLSLMQNKLERFFKFTRLGERTQNLLVYNN
jgi:hypothetical protein